jgi:hypothetical protein
VEQETLTLVVLVLTIEVLAVEDQGHQELLVEMVVMASLLSNTDLI